jgi:hypothetical protein
MKLTFNIVGSDTIWHHYMAAHAATFRYCMRVARRRRQPQGRPRGVPAPRRLCRWALRVLTRSPAYLNLGQEVCNLLSLFLFTLAYMYDSGCKM